MIHKLRFWNFKSTDEERALNLMDLTPFPLGIAKDEQFCNRVQETEKLVSNISRGRHTVLIAPRRYGKTSLAYRAIGFSGLPNARIDLFMALSAQDIERAILNGVSELISSLSSSSEKLLALTKDYLKSLRLSFEANTSSGLAVKLSPIESGQVPESIKDALHILDQVLSQKNKRAVLLLDEFQEIERVAKDQGIEGSIRHVIQETTHLSVIFSGSHRAMLQSMFNDRNKPLYRLCDELAITCIAPEEYGVFIRKMAKKTWGKVLSFEALEEILSCTECHPYYVNAVCDPLFLLKDLPDIADVKKIWQSMIQRGTKDVVMDPSNLTIAEKKILVAVAHGINTGLSSQEFLSRSDLSSATALKAIKFLLEEDYLKRDQEGRLALIDPLLKASLQALRVL